MESFEENSEPEMGQEVEVKDTDEKPEEFLGIMNIENVEVSDDNDCEIDYSASTKNPNKDDPRRLFQVYNPVIVQDSDIPYAQQEDRLASHGPVPLQFPDNFYDVQGGISVIYWESDRSTACLCTIDKIFEERQTFTFQCFNFQGKRKKTFFETGKTPEAH